MVIRGSKENNLVLYPTKTNRGPKNSPKKNRIVEIITPNPNIFLSELPNLKANKKSEGKIFDTNKLSKKIISNSSNNFMPERPKNLKIKKRAYRLSRWRRRKLSRV